MEPSGEDGGKALVAGDGGAREERRKGLARVRGVGHLCDAAGCELPPEGFWKKGKGGRSAPYKGRRS